MHTTRRALMFAAGAAALAPAMATAPAVRAQQLESAPNLFISPHGEPFRAALAEPYPVANWFHRADKNGDGKIDHAEFLADAELFFAVLDRNKDGILDPYEISIYEHLIAPEIIGLQFRTDAGGARPFAAGEGRLIRVQLPDGMNPGSGQPTGPPGGIDPSGEGPNQPKIVQPDSWASEGASPYSLLLVPEPVTSADPDFMFRGRVRKDRFMAMSDQRFRALDQDEAGFLTLAKLPKTAVQEYVEQAQRKHRRR